MNPQLDLASNGPREAINRSPVWFTVPRGVLDRTTPKSRAGGFKPRETLLNGG